VHATRVLGSVEVKSSGQESVHVLLYERHDLFGRAFSIHVVPVVEDLLDLCLQQAVRSMEHACRCYTELLPRPCRV
jgi:hypothetical protein